MEITILDMMIRRLPEISGSLYIVGLDFEFDIHICMNPLSILAHLGMQTSLHMVHSRLPETYSLPKILSSRQRIFR